MDRKQHVITESFAHGRTVRFLRAIRHSELLPNASEFCSPKIEIRGVSKNFGEWYQKTNTTEYTNKLTLLAFKIVTILHNTLLTTFIKLLETVSKCLFRNRSQNRCHTSAKRAPLMMLFRRGNRKKSTHRTPLIWRLQCVMKDGDYFEGQ
jgi:hypothetical protein